MAEEKPFDPTPSRLARAKREGDVPSSQALGVIGALGAASLAAFALLGPLASSARVAFVAAAAGRPSSVAYACVAAAALAVPVASAIGAIATAFLQNGKLSLRFPSFKLEKLHPGQGFKRMFSRDAAVGGAKAFVVALVVTLAIAPSVGDAFAAGGAGSAPAELAALAVTALWHSAVAALLVASAFATIDVLLERAKWKRRLRMSFDEIKREHKQNEGDPTLRWRRRQAHRALIRGSIGRVKDAAFVVCNPTHVAIALAYAPPAIAVPQVLVRGIDEGALEIKRRARELHVPVVENVVLARALLATTETGDFIPPDTYAAVAAIVAGLIRERAIA